MPDFLRRNRHGGYHYRRALPPDVRHAFDGKGEIVMSLRTYNRRDAALLAQQVNLGVESIIRQTRGEPMPKQRDSVGWTYKVETHPDGKVTETRKTDPGDIAELRNSGMTPADIAVVLSAWAQPQGAPQAPPSIGIGALYDAFESDLTTRKSARGKQWKPIKNSATYRRRLTEILGDKPALQVTRADARRVRDTLVQLPANSAAHRGKTVSEMLKAPRLESQATLTPKSVNSHVEYYERVFDFALNEGHTQGSNPFAGLSIEDHQDPSEKRDAFTSAELITMFSTKLYTAYGSDQEDQPYRYWMPLLLLATGARRAEIAGLYLSDIKEDSGVPYIDITDSQPDKRVKTHNAKRRTPIHSEIIRLGFLDYVESRRKAGVTRLFPELRTYSASDGYARNFGDWFGSYLKKLGIGKTSHSFRHTMATQLNELGVAPNRIEELSGRKFTKQTVGQQVYIKETSIRELSLNLEQLDLAQYLTRVTPFIS